MRNYKLTIQYDGTQYYGWQRLPGKTKTLQGVLEENISKLLGYKVTIDGSGRTDAGVHAMGQVANVKTSGKIEEEKFVSELNELLPKDMYVSNMVLMKNSFHSRYNAKGKEYSYTVDSGQKAGVFDRKYAYHFPKKIDIDKMITASKILTGTHDFTSFSDNKEHKTNVRTVHKIHIEKKGNRIIFTVAGNGFLNHMVRILVGTLLEVGTGNMSLTELEQVLTGKDRGKSGPIVPAKGLKLNQVFY